MAESVSREKRNQVAGRLDFACLVWDRAGQGRAGPGSDWYNESRTIGAGEADKGKYSCGWDASR